MLTRRTIGPQPAAESKRHRAETTQSGNDTERKRRGHPAEKGNPPYMSTPITKRIQGLVSLFWREVAKFGTVGGLAFIIDNGLYWWLINGPMAESVVKGRFVSAMVATLFSWVANRY